MSGNSMRENRETPLVSGGSTPGRREKATSYKASMNAGGESDEQVVPAKRLNKGGQSPAEGVEGSCSNAAIQNAIEPALPLTQVLAQLLGSLLWRVQSLLFRAASTNHPALSRTTPLRNDSDSKWPGIRPGCYPSCCIGLQPKTHSAALPAARRRDERRP
jgi:hypothetical protein